MRDRSAKIKIGSYRGQGLQKKGFFGNDCGLDCQLDLWISFMFYLRIYKNQRLFQSGIAILFDKPKWH